MVRVHPVLIVSFIILMASGCAALKPGVRDRAQAVFLYHNQVASDLMLASTNPDLTDSQFEELDMAESEMLAACEPLDRLASTLRDGGNPSRQDRLKIPSVLDDCEGKTAIVEQWLKENSQ